ncbi:MULTISPECIES: TetR family transcriptional regulator [Paraburkholderia]|uniref:TetR family transcriptional regulator n=2 Tax=Burkholderiaceae TaxID=119060 RepID=UPI0009F1F9A0|nr:TetR family transcriptional regulator [Paraburkholderia nodosa]
MMKRKVQGLVTREKILDSAEILFFERGVSATSLEDIAHAAGMTRGAIYGHFSNKWALVTALFERSALPLDPFTIPPEKSNGATLGALRSKLERRLADVLHSGTQRRLYSIAFSTAKSEGDTVVSTSTLGEAARIAQSSIESALRLAAANRVATDHVDYAVEAIYIHSLLTGCFHLSLLMSSHQGAEQALASAVVGRALSPLL